MNQVARSQAGPQLSVSVNLKSSDTPAKIQNAAQQFEGLLLAQILGSVHKGGGWLGSSDDSSSAATSFAEQQLAEMIAQKGGLGLAAMIAKGLENENRR